jgi:hypothetical protein
MKKLLFLVVVILGITLHVKSQAPDYQTDGYKAAMNVFERPNLFNQNSDLNFEKAYREEKIQMLRDALSLDKSDEHPYVNGVYECADFALQHIINFFGYEDPEGYQNYDKYNWGDNGKYNYPVYDAATKISEAHPDYGTFSGGHAICAMFVGPKDKSVKENPLDFTQWYFWEPQNDQEVKPGDWNMNKNEGVIIMWHGKTNSDLGGVYYDSSQLIKWNLNNGVPTLVENFTTSYLILENPHRQPADVTEPTGEAPADVTVEYADNMDLSPNALGQATSTDNIDPNPVESYTDESTQESSGYGKYNFTITRTWISTDNSGNVGNLGAQTITVNDTEAPTISNLQNKTIEYVDLPDLSVEAQGEPMFSDNGDVESKESTDVSTKTNDGTINQVNFTLTRNWTATDFSNNESTGSEVFTLVYTGTPTFDLVSEVKVAEGESLDAEISKAPLNVADPSGIAPSLESTHYTIPYEGGSVTRVTWTATNVVGNKFAQTKKIVYGNPVITDDSKPHHIRVYREKNNLVVKYFSDNKEKARIQIIDMGAGKLLKEVEVNLETGSNVLTVNFPKSTKLTLIRIIDSDTTNVQSKMFNK